MKRTGKWIDGTTPEQPVTEAARLAIDVRLMLVAHYLPLAARRADEDCEYVHQLRVATRRAAAALEMFADWLPPRRLKRMQKRLKTVRRAAGDARDLDVLIERLRGLSAAAPSPLWPELLDELEVRRQQAQPPIRRVRKQLVAWNFKQKIRGLVQRVRVRGATEGTPPPTFVAAARGAVTPLVEVFFAAMHGPQTDLAAMHQCRIHGKHLRYAMEVFAGAFPPEFRDDLYPQIEHVQELLGQVNDRATAGRQFAEWLESTPDEARRELLSTLLAEESAALEQARQHFATWWSADRAASLAAEFARYLGTLRVIPAERAAAVG